MKSEIKERIKQIKKGQVPKGYKKTKVGIIPQEWEVEAMEFACDTISKGTTPKQNEMLEFGDVPYLRVNNLTFTGNLNLKELLFVNNNIHTGFLKRSIVKQGDILMNIVGPPLGKICKVNNKYMEYNINQAIAFFRPKQEFDSEYIYNYINSHKSLEWLISRSKQTSGQVNLTLELCRELPFVFPNKQEQTQIASILSTWDTAIEKQEKLVELKKDQKKWLMQELLTGKKRLKGFSGEWEESKLKKILITRNEKFEISEKLPLFSLTIEKGVTPKTERYERGFLVKSDEKKYKLTKFNDIVYNPANLRFGAIALNKVNEDVLLSPIYEVLFIKNNEKYDINFISDILTSSRQILIFSKKAEGTLVERMAVKIDAFLNTKIKIPKDIKEQKAISDILSTADQEVNLLEKELEAMKEQKKGLMQLLLTGIVRV